MIQICGIIFALTNYWFLEQLCYSNNYFVNSINTRMINVKNLRPTRLGVFIASALLTAGYVQAAEPEATEGNTPVKAEASAVAAKDTASESTSYDLYHTVAKGENLWVLAKRFTGNANNWKALSRANELGENGVVKPGQIIRIPADLNKVAIESVPSTSETGTQVADKAKPDAQDTSETVTIPASFKGEPAADLPE